MRCLIENDREKRSFYFSATLYFNVDRIFFKKYDSKSNEKTNLATEIDDFVC